MAAVTVTLAMLPARPPSAEAAADNQAAEPAAGEPALIDVIGACPDAASVHRLLDALVSPGEARLRPVSIQDRGPRFRVAVGEVATMLDDPARDCAERARQAAAVAAAELQTRKVVFGPPLWTIEKGFVLEMAPGTESSTAVGAEFRVALGSNAWSAFGAAGARGPVTLTLNGGREAEVLRFPLDAGARLTVYRWRLRPWLGLGGSVTVMRFLGHNLVETNPEWRVGLGALAMAGATLRVAGRFGVATALAVRWEPRRFDLQVDPLGTIGQTPAWWLTLSLNYTIDGKGSTPP
jgi:hypothetical protein